MFLTIVTNVFNDIIVAVAVSIGYIRKGQFKFQINTLILILVALLFAFIGVYILMITALGSIYGWVIPAVIICLGASFIRSGYTSIERLKSIVRNIYIKFVKDDLKKVELLKENRKLNNDEDVEIDEVNEVIPYKSRLFYIIAIIFGLFLGINSGLFGANSGMIIVLALIILYGYPIKKSIGTALILSILVNIFTFTIYQIYGITLKGTYYFNLEISFCLAIGSIITGFLFSTYIQHLSAKKMGKAMGIVMVSLGSIALCFNILVH